MDPTLDVHPGEVLAGKYRIERLLGQGGMGVVVAATHIQLDERIAIKFLLPDALQNPEAVARFAREARAAVKIKSEHVARVIDVGTLQTGCPYMVMEYLHGKDLGGLVAERGALGIEESVDYLLQAGEALAEAHVLGIVHRDLKPANLFYTQRADGSACIKVLDFGISKLTGLSGSGSDLGMTKTTSVMGSPLYMSPEQMTSSRDVDQGTDIWALGVILYELLTGRVPFEADTMPQLCAMILQHPAPPLRNVRPDAPESLQKVVLCCLEKDPKKRFRNMAELARALLPFSSRGGRTSVERISRILGVAGVATQRMDIPESVDSFRAPTSPTQSAWGQTQGPAKRRGPFLAIGMGMALIATGAAAVFLLGRAPSAAERGTEAAGIASNTTLQASNGNGPQPAAGNAPSASPGAASSEPRVEPVAPPSTKNKDIPRATLAPPPRTLPAASVKRVPATAALPALKPAPPPASLVKKPAPDLYSDRK